MLPQRKRKARRELPRRTSMIKARISIAAIAASLLLAPAASAQAGGDYTAPRAADGKPDMQGFWINTSLTSLER
jgi:hypothetical protein